MISACAKGKLSFLKGNASAYVASPGIYQPVPEELTISDALYLEGDFIAQLQFDNYKLIYPSVTAQSDIFYIIKDSKIEIGFDFITMAQNNRERLTLDKDSECYFLHHSLHRPGETFFKEIRRLLIGDGVIIFNDESFEIVSLPIKTWVVKPEDFISGLKAFCIHQNPIDDKEYLLFSGGRDSSLLGLLLNKEFGKKVHLVTSIPKKFNDGGCYNEKFEVYADIIGEIEKIGLDYDEYTWETIRPIVSKMPLAAHIIAGYDTINKFIDLHDGRPWTGQDADCMYCLGYSGDGYLEMMERFFISDGFLKSLNDVKGKSLSRLIGQLIAWGGSRRTGKHLCAPKNIQELKSSVINMYSTVPIVNASARAETSSVKHSLSEARHILWANKVSLYVTARDHRSITYAGECRKPAIFPYSSAMMYFIYVNMSRGISEIMANKKLISNQIKYYIGKERFNKIYPSDFWMKKRVSMEYENNILMHSKFGESLRSMSRNKDTVLSRVLADCWREEVYRIIGI